MSPTAVVPLAPISAGIFFVDVAVSTRIDVVIEHGAHVDVGDGVGQEITPRMGLALGCVMEMAVSAIKER